MYNGAELKGIEAWCVGQFFMRKRATLGQRSYSHSLYYTHSSKMHDNEDALPHRGGA